MLEEDLIYLATLKQECLHLAIPLAHSGAFPQLGQPIDDAWSREADEYVRRLSRGEHEEPSPEVAVALFPRLQMAGGLHATAGDPPEGETLLEWLLLTWWHQQWKGQWLSGDLRPLPRAGTGDDDPPHRL